MIRVSNLSKTYLIWRTPFSRLFVPLVVRLLRPFFPQYCHALFSRECQSIRALESVDFCIEEGNSLGIIGLNGSGKSTLLQIIAGTLQPTSGSVEVKGRVAALLELGSGFDPEFSGRENIYINASILGLTRAEIDARYDAIVAFADIGDFIDRPVKTYSSGMMVRLAFAVQVHVDPDVLIVDEALSVGDARFQAKALNKIEEILKRGTTLLFVGHDLSAVRSFCNQAILLDKGQVIKSGLPDDVIADYLFLVQKDRIAELSNGLDVARNEKGFAVHGFDVVQARFREMGQHATLAFNQSLILDVDIVMTIDVASPELIVDIIDNRGMQLTGKRITIPRFNGEKRVSINMACGFQKGIYRVRLRLVNAPSIEQTLLMSRYDDLLSIEMIEDVRDRFTGLFPIPMTIDWSSADRVD
ncbi:polysaccharide ABC transporter ATP-binding protein [Cellvibrio sp. pealriver]|uniref:ABC transporter ATP-binding protein n=1 Tax=Cellvibrio sp. pealriver TaxID=1622269 RepID=UPI0009E4501D|nr:polysaccharide ABC transporter ATP-binding protein [Cellvibrio sp. pealriver]